MLKNLRWHIGIAPLKDNELNESKSDIKFLDYSAIGAASVCSNLAAYQDTVAQNDTGLLVDDDPGDWVDAIEGLICDPRIRLDIQKASREYLIKYRTLRVNARKWLQAVAN
jgi:glycosyltransferase involved in cell wall biosynthesis